MSGADCITTDVKIHLGKRPLVAGDDDSRLGKRGERGGVGAMGYFHPSKMDVLMHLLHVKSSTTCHINISVFMDVGRILEGRGGEELSVVQGEAVAVLVCL